MQNQIQLLLQIIKNKLQSKPQLVLYDVMMLPDNTYQYLFAELSMEMNIPQNELKQYYSEAVNQNFQTKLTPINSNILQSNGISYIQKITQKELFAEQKRRFAEILAQVLKEYNIQSNPADHKQMCTYVDICIQEHGQKRFWTSMSQLMPEKTVKQLRDYYTRSFQQVLYNCQLSYDDKRVLKQLMQQYSQEQPTTIANHFMKHFSSEDNNYCHRNIVVYIINCRRK
ncbi:SANT/Myb_domain [Hexamita inflata]|uniref:SANT/Myb domain n=1 Tax=Hexamita inflata TaxID=28002 RepID=A0AA86RGL9_9EUKA|nr:SANT/Myb domain [Hexamita inflata]